MIIDDKSGLEIHIYYLECLAQATYLILHEDCALIVDPRRDIEAFIQVSESLPIITLAYTDGESSVGA